MTSEQTEQLRAMTEQQAVRHYWEKYRKGELTREQYDQGIEYWKKLQNKEPIKSDNPRPNEEHLPLPDTVTTAGLIDAFGGYEIPAEKTPERKMSQKERILELLKDYQPHKVSEIRDKVYGVNGQGNACIHSRITELRQEGWDIPPASGTGTDRVYQLKNNNKLI